MENLNKKCLILGGGGHAKVVIESLRLTGIAIAFAILDVDENLWGTEVLNVPVIGGDDKLPELAASGLTYFTVGVGAIDNTAPRRRMYDLGLSHSLVPLTIVHPSALVAKSATIGAGCQVMAGAIINPGTKIGAGAIINTGAIIEHDCSLGDQAHIAPGARLGGSVHIGSGAVVGIGAVIIPSIRIGNNAMIGAGAVVVGDVPINTKVLGVPATPVNNI